MTAMNMRSPITRRVLAPVVVTGLLLVGVTACGSSSDKKASDTVSSDQTTDGTTAGSTAAGTDSSATDTDTTADTGTGTDSDAAAPDPCAKLSAEQVSTLVGFKVEGDGAAADNGAGFVSCTYTAALDDSAAAGASVTIGAERSTDSVDTIKDALKEMGGSDAEPTAVEVGDGGWLLLSKGFAELRAKVGDIQIDVNVITPMGESADLAKPTTDVATAVATNLS
jgi:hypothetical protein